MHLFFFHLRSLTVTFFFFGDRAPPDRSLAVKVQPGIKSSKTRLTFALACNALGDEKLEPLIIGKARKPRCFNGKEGSEHGFLYYNNDTAWMKHHIFQDWLEGFNLKCASNQRYILLLLDNFSGHLLPPTPLSNIKVEFFEPNMTSHIQPLDAGIIRNFKSNYRARYIGRAVLRYDRGCRDSDAIFAIDQKQAMDLAKKSWGSVSPVTIRNCWLHTGIIDLAHYK